MQSQFQGAEEVRPLLVQMIKLLLVIKPNDPVPFIYSYLKQKQNGIENPELPTNLEVAEIKNLRKKYELLKSQVIDDDEHTESDEDDEESDEEEVKQPVKRSNKQRAGVSAEVYGDWNKKSDFVPPVHAKSQETKQKLRNRLLSAFMFGALDESELNIVIDAIVEVQVAKGQAVIVEGDAGDCMYVLESGSLDCTKVFKGKTEPTHLKVYHPGEGFGELALLYNAPRAATITACEQSTVWRLDRDTFNHIVKDAAQ